MWVSDQVPKSMHMVNWCNYLSIVQVLGVFFPILSLSSRAARVRSSFCLQRATRPPPYNLIYSFKPPASRDEREDKEKERKAGERKRLKETLVEVSQTQYTRNTLSISISQHLRITNSFPKLSYP